MSTDKDVVDATRFYLITLDRVKEERKSLNEELSAAKDAMNRSIEDLGQGSLFDNKPTSDLEDNSKNKFDDPMIDTARKIVAENGGQISISNIQRELNIGYNRALKLVENL